MITANDILVVGLGSSGIGSARYAASMVSTGEAHSVTAVDSKDTPALHAIADELRERGVSVVLGTDIIEGHYDLAIASPGIPPHAPILKAARAASERLVSEIEFAFGRSSQSWVAITGTNGKTTTTSLVAHLLKCAGIPARTVGNIGTVAIEAVEQACADEVLVAEVSSFQLSNIAAFRPRVAVLLNVTPDHVDYHGSLEAYADAKARVFENLSTGDIAVIDVDDPGSAGYATLVEARGIDVVRVGRSVTEAGGATVTDRMLQLDSPAGPIRLVFEDELLIHGAHNVANALAAAAAAHAVGAGIEGIREGLRTFEPIEHRLEPVAEIDGVEWFNDSKATNPDAVLKALTAFGERPIVLMLGGRNKGSDMRGLARASDQRAKAVVAFGEASDEIAQAFEGLTVRFVCAANLADAVEKAAALASSGDAVVLSPACASFDEFRSYEHRGDTFKVLVRARDAGDAR
ncbi:MAG: UDP-N-acetylmuramoyl-L-alanine--D-glutamate ligase [Coriobacteriia bacterium]|nr:UDP-N-acetylmuramoyl-L-alanine--D-glutamate ligase [Coriobacteriia bacterium]